MMQLAWWFLLLTVLQNGTASGADAVSATAVSASVVCGRYARAGPFHPKIERKKVVLIHKNISSMGKGGVNFLEFFIENIWSLTQNLLHLCSCKAQIYKPKARMRYS